MKVFGIKRTHFRSDGTFGILDEEGQPFAVTVEPIKDAVGRYLIPTGEYICKRVDSPKFGNTFEITGVKGHDHVLFHWGNFDTDSLACVIVGEKFTVLKNRTAVGESKSVVNEGFNELLMRTEGIDEFKLIVQKAEVWIA